MVEKKLLEIKDIESYPCVSIMMNTHRSFPENDQDPILLKNLVSEAELRLLREFEERSIRPLLENLRSLEAKTDHDHNLDSMAIFLHEDRYEVVRLPIGVENRVVINHNFATRDLWRRMQFTSGYYVFTINQEEVRLIEGANGRLTREVESDFFPMENDRFHSPNRHQTTMAKGADNQYREFFNQADKALHKILNARPMPVVLAGEKRNRAYYHEVSDDERHLIGHIGPQRKGEDAGKIAREAWPVVYEHLQQKRKKFLEDLARAQNQQKAVSDVLSIFEMARNGQADTVFVERGYFQPARKSNGHWELIENSREKGAVDDLVDEIIEQVIKNKGEVVFMEPGELEDYRGMALIARY